MQELTKEKYSSLKTMFDDKYCPTFVYSILDQTIPGAVYADDQTFPKSFFIGTESGIILLRETKGIGIFMISLQDIMKNK